MAIPTSREELKNYCLRQLGDPISEINIDEDQIEDCVDDALQYFAEYHFDGTEHVFIAHQITQADIDNEYFLIDSNILSVVSVIQQRQGFFGGFFNEEYQLRLGDFISDSFSQSTGTSGILDFVITEQYINQIIDSTTAEKSFNFNKKQDKIFILGNWGDYTVGHYVIFECLRIVDPETYTEVYSDSFLKRYLTSLIKKQWGTNMKKFDGVQLPGGITMNGQKIFDEAIQELVDLQQEMRNSFELPPYDIIA